MSIFIDGETHLCIILVGIAKKGRQLFLQGFHETILFICSPGVHGIFKEFILVFAFCLIQGRILTVLVLTVKAEEILCFNILFALDPRN